MLHVCYQCVMCFSVLLFRMCGVWLCLLHVSFVVVVFDVGVHLDEKKKSWVSCRILKSEHEHLSIPRHREDKQLEQD
jgi:hypothetical protein